MIEKTLGIAQGRKLPRFRRARFMRRAGIAAELTQATRRTGRKVVYFVDTYANYHDPQLAEALVAVLEHNGVAVYVHPDQRASGMAMVSRWARSIGRAQWPATACGFWPRPCGRAIRSWPASLRPRSA